MLVSLQKRLMSKDSQQVQKAVSQKLKFSEFWQTIAAEMGDSRLKINANAESIRTFLDAEGDHRSFLRTLIHQSYKRCHCYHLHARFDVNIALDMLGETNYHLQNAREDDLLDVELLEEIAWLVNEHYFHLIEMPASILQCKKQQRHFDDNHHSPNTRSAPHIVSMSKLKIQRANNKM
jgi:hypothetical protein